MPNYRYECLREANGCGQQFTDFKPMHARQNTQCPNCGQDGCETYVRPDGTLGFKVVILPPKIRQIHDIDHQDGRTGQSIPMPALGPDVRVSSRRELKEALVRAREEYYRATNGPHSTMRPFVNPDTGETVLEKVTLEKEGFDLGELHVLDAPEENRPLKSPFDPKLSADEHIKRLEDSVGPMEHPAPRRKRGRPRKNP